VVKAEMFPANIRALGVGLPYGIGVAVFGGSAEYVALAFKNAGMESGFFWYVAVLCAFALAAAVALPDTKVNSLIETR
jgi:MHS family alpha-ketoglutarate permease-like MFS transporter